MVQVPWGEPMSATGFVKENWRLILLVVFVSGALLALFVPGGIMGDDNPMADEGDEDREDVQAGITNLQYGLGLEGGTRISAPPVGMTAEGLEIEPGNDLEVEQTLYDELEVDPADATVRLDEDAEGHTEEVSIHTAEVFTDEVTESEFVDALNAAGVEATEDDVRAGVTAETRENMMRTIELKIDEAGLAGAQVTERTAIDGSHFITVEVPDMTPTELRNLLSERGVVEVWAYHPDEDGGQTNETVLQQGDFATVDPATYDERMGHHVPVTITAEKAPEFQERMNELGFTQEGVGQCEGYDGWQEAENQYCLFTVVDGEVVDAHSMGSDLAPSMRTGGWADDPTFVMLAPSQPEAHSLSANLRAGALDAPLDFEQEQTFSISPALADQFQTYSLFIGILSVLSVSGMVYLRYSDARVAAPMIVTALAEVVILLGFAALIRMPLDLSHIAGFIAVIGTGVDDLVIIADEVMDEGEVNSQKVFDSRFSKAFWIIGAAAATTIVALSPLAVLSLGDLRGFAIITILGVLIGVFITRPAYGDILRILLTGDK